MSKLPAAFYRRPDVVVVARELLGKKLVSRVGGARVSGYIVEAEAYAGRGDKACHAHNQRFTKRTSVMYETGGIAYVYLCYGVHHLLNVVTNADGMADAVLIRALEPAEGIETMLERRKAVRRPDDPRLTAGPGILTQALGVSTQHNRENLTGDLIWVEDAGKVVSSDEIQASPRVGVGYAEEDALKPWRFRVKDSKWTSPAK